MLVSHRRRFIYLKTFKTASTSVEILFEPECEPEGAAIPPRHDSVEHETAAGIVGGRMEGRYAGEKWPAHITAAALRDKIGAEMFNAYLKFCVIRNPFDKVVSRWWWVMNRPGGQMPAHDARFEEVRAAFNAWVMSPEPDFGYDRDRYTIDGEVCVQRFLRYENLWADIQDLCKELGITKMHSELGAYKSGIRFMREPFPFYYDEPAARKVASEFDWELKRFGYTL
jgi:hypothetical protein